MSDLIEEALHDNEYEKERSASGCVDGTEVEVKKESYTTKLQDKEWKVAVYLNGNDYHDEQEAGLSAKDAEKIFQRLVEKYDLRSSSDTVFQELSEMDEMDEETIERIREIASRDKQDDVEVGEMSDDKGTEEVEMWCKECGTKAKHGTGIGHYCPNQDCRVGDGPELVDNRAKAKDQDIGREVNAEDCDECGGTLKKVEDTVHATGFADSFKAECVDCGHTQHVPAW